MAISSDGIHRVAQPDIKLIVNDRHFIIEVFSSRRDPNGRIAPLICHGEHKGKDLDALAKTVSAGIETFAEDAGIPLHQNTSETILLAFRKWAGSRGFLMSCYSALGKLENCFKGRRRKLLVDSGQAGQSLGESVPVVPVRDEESQTSSVETDTLITEEP